MALISCFAVKVCLISFYCFSSTIMMDKTFKFVFFCLLFDCQGSAVLEDLTSKFWCVKSNHKFSRIKSESPWCKLNHSPIESSPQVWFESDLNWIVTWICSALVASYIPSILINSHMHSFELLAFRKEKNYSLISLMYILMHICNLTHCWCVVCFRWHLTTHNMNLQPLPAVRINHLLDYFRIWKIWNKKNGIQPQAVSFLLLALVCIVYIWHILFFVCRLAASS